jgi:hypothetical protein
MAKQFVIVEPPALFPEQLHECFSRVREAQAGGNVADCARGEQDDDEADWKQ